MSFYQYEQTAKRENCRLARACQKHLQSVYLQNKIIAKIKELEFYASKQKNITKLS
ncbi:MAG TPA: hypothetical protein PLG15_01545 [Candidatus Gastranaerophilaceae bacterium]|nr:hypothetical protein [Candidatus Gastranaerophilaceae bacterium]HPT41051.1 hypothetical protein [Candidatus Gastranaerophilaceae bacterium]